MEGAHRYEDQDVDGLAAEFLYPGFFGMFGRAEEAAFPLSMHVGTNAYVPREQRRRPVRPDAIADYAASRGTVQRTIVEFMCRGVCERHPNLKIVVAEFNAGWIAHWLDRVDQGLFRRGFPSTHSLATVWPDSRSRM